MRHALLVPLFLVGSLVAGEVAAPTRAATAEYSHSSLVERSPFAKPDKSGKPAPSGPIELRGFFGAGATLEVSLVRPDTKEAAWVRVGDKTSKWFVESAEAEAGTADVRFDGLTLHLKLVRPEAPSFTLKGGATTEKGTRRGGMSGLSPAARDLMFTGLRQGWETLRKEHPEYFTNAARTDEQQKAFAAARTALFAKVREDVAKAFPADAPALAEMQDRFRARPRSGEDGGSAAQPEPGTSSPAAPAGAPASNNP